VVTRIVALVALLLAAGFLLTACGGDDEENDEEAASAITCEGDALDGDTGLPAKFPTPTELTYVKTEQRGPTRVVNAYFEGSLEMAYEDYRNGFESAGMKILFDEIEDDDSEVSYEDPDSQTTGIVALRAECDDDNRISVRITNRPE
jgi:hypothetical protein